MGFLEPNDCLVLFDIERFLRSLIFTHNFMDHFAVAINELQLVDKLGGFHFNGSDGSVFGELERLIDISESTNLP